MGDLFDATDGSSPRLRGTGFNPRKRPDWLRFIPAPAGNSEKVAGVAWKLTVHPRACGEQSTAKDDFNSRGGSSPRLRGTDQGSDWTGDIQRFIPAPAGNSTHYSSFDQRLTVHPRACGEQNTPLLDSGLFPGSSPRLRGTGGYTDSGDNCNRFIPAPAGNSDRRDRTSSNPPVHPRACGEQNVTVNRRDSDTGSSPRLRGTGYLLSRTKEGSRFIPAPAGNRYQPQWIKPDHPVHPRACGEQIGNRIEGPCQDGSSPRLRGTD